MDDIYQIAVPRDMLVPIGLWLDEHAPDANWSHWAGHGTNIDHIRAMETGDYAYVRAVILFIKFTDDVSRLYFRLRWDDHAIEAL